MPVGFYIKKNNSRQSSAAFSRQAEQLDPTILDQVKAGFEAGYDAPGSFSEDFDAYNVRRSKGEETTFFQDAANFVISPFIDDRQEPTREDPLTKERYERSEYFREQLPFEEGLTPTAAKIRARRLDNEQRRQQIFEQSGTIGRSAYIASSLSGAIGDVKNVAAGVATGGALAGVGVSRKAFKAAEAAMMSRSALTLAGAKIARQTFQTAGAARKTRGGLATAGGLAAEATVSSLPAVISGMQNQPDLASEYGVSDALLDIAASAMFSVGLNAVTRGTGTLYNRVAHIREKRAAAEVLQAQIAAGEKIDIDPVMEAQMASKIQEFTTVNVDSTPTIRQRSDGTFEARFDGDEGVMQGVRAEGQTFEEAVGNLRGKFTDNLTAAAAEVGVEPDRLSLLRDHTELREQLRSFDAEKQFRQIAEEKGLPVAQFRELQNKIGKAEQRLEKAETQLQRRPSSTDRRTEVANARQNLDNLRTQAEELRRTELSEADIEVANRRKALSDQLENVKSAVKEIQGKAARRNFEEFARRQTQEVTPRSARNDRLVEQIDEQQIDADAARAPDPDAELNPSAAQASRAELESRLESDLVPEESKVEIRNSLKSIDDTRRRADSLRQYLVCKRS